LDSLEKLSSLQLKQMRHASTRVAKRYGLRLPPEDYFLLLSLIHEGQAEFVCRTKRGGVLYRLSFRKHVLHACYDPKTRMIATFFSPFRKERCVRFSGGRRARYYVSPRCV